MRGDNEQQAGMYSYISPEQRVPADHPLRPIRKMTDEIFKQLSPRFDKLYSRVGRPSIAPERLPRALLLQVLYSVRSERMLMEQLQYNMLFRWFVGLNMDDEVWNATTVRCASAARQSYLKRSRVTNEKLVATELNVRYCVLYNEERCAGLPLKLERSLALRNPAILMTALLQLSCS